MNIAIILAGQFRGNNEMVKLHKENVGDYDTYISCLNKYVDEWKDSDWNPKQIYEVPMVDFKDTLWAKHRNSPADESGFWQFWNLKYVLKNVPQYDFYIKSRNDLVIESKLNIDFNTLDDNTILTVGIIKETVKKIKLRIHNENVDDSYDRIQNYKKRK